MLKWKGNPGRYFALQVANIVVLSVPGKGVHKIFTIFEVDAYVLVFAV